MKNLPIMIFAIFLAISCNDKPEAPPYINVFYVYPNPVYSEFTIEVRETIGKPYTIKVFDPSGENVFDQKDQIGDKSFKVQIDEYPKGNYHVILVFNGSTYTKNVIKI